MRNLIIILGDQLNEDSAAFDGFDSDMDGVWMAEVAQESTRVWSSKPRTAIFLSAMRHFRDRLTSKRMDVFYRELTAAGGECGGEVMDFPRQAQQRRLLPL